MDFATYESSGRSAYAWLSATISDILTAVIAQQYQLRVQQIQHSAKDPRSLRRKLERASALDSVGEPPMLRSRRK